MNRIVFRYFAALMMVCTMLLPASLSAQEPMKSKEKKALLEEISSGYTSWESAAWQGKLKMDMLPVTPTVKVFMQRGKLTLVSLRVPLMGEVGRIEVDTDSVLVVNKMKKRYWSGSAAEFSGMAEMLLENSQLLMLGRAIVAGHGELNKDQASMVEAYALPDGASLVVPDMSDIPLDGSYGYAFNAAHQLAGIMVTSGKPATASGSGNSTDMSATIDISYSPKGADAAIAIASPKLSVAATLEVGWIEWDAKPFERITLGKGYQRASIKDCLSM